MSGVDTVTGEVLTAVEPMGEAEARVLIDLINRSGLDLVNSTERFWRGQGWLAVGFDSWDQLCEAKVIDVPRLGRDQRRELVQSLRGIGMSTRAIASATGVGKGTVGRDLAGAPFGAPAQPVTGTDGKTYPATPKQQHDEMQATSETTWADVIVAYPIAADARPGDREGLRRAFVQLQTMTGPEKVRREEAFLASLDLARLTDEQLEERRNQPPKEVRQLRCRSCGRPFTEGESQ